MKKSAILLAFFSVILSSCSQLKEMTVAPAPAPAPPPVKVAAPVLPIPQLDPDDYVLKNDFVKFKQQLMPKPELEKVFQTQQEKVEELNRNLAILQKNAVAKPELAKAQEQMVSMTYFTQYAAEQQDIIKELQRQNLAMRDISKDMVNNAAKIAELRCDAAWYKIKIALVTGVGAILALLGIIYFKLSRRPKTNSEELKE